MADKSISVALGIDISSFTKGLKKATEQVSKAAKNMGSAMKGLGKGLTIGLTAPIAAVGVGMLKLASDAEEVQSKFDIVFKKMSKDANKWAVDFANTVGRGTTETKKMASEFGDLLKPMGFTEAEALKMSQSMVGLATDLASFNNTSDKEAFEKIRAGLIGSSEPLLAFGIDTREANVQQHALAAGIITTGQKMTEQQKVLARITTMYNMSTDAQGDAMRTQDTFAAASKRFSAAIKNVGEQFGAILLPMATKFIGIISTLINWFGGLSGETKTLILIILGIAAAVGPVLIAFGALISSFGVVIGAIPAIAAAFFGIILPLGLIIIAVLAVIGAWDDLKAAGMLLINGLLGFFDTGADGIFKTFFAPFSKWVDDLILIFQFAKNNTKQFIGAILSLFINLPRILINKVLKGIQFFANKVIATYNRMAKFIGKKTIKPVAFEKLKDDYVITFEDMEAVTKKVFSSVKKGADKVGAGMKSAFGGAVDGIKAKMQELTGIDLSAAGGGIDALLKKLNAKKPGGGGALPNPAAGGGKAGGSAPGFDPKSFNIKPSMDQQKAFVDEFAEHVGLVSETVKGTFFSMYDAITTGMSDAISSMIFDGATLKDTMLSLMEDLARQAIDALVKIGMQFVTNAVIGTAATSAQSVAAISAAKATAVAVTVASKAQGIAAIGTAAAVTFANAFSAISAIPIVGPALAPGIASAAAAAAKAGGMGMLALAKGGITTGPTNALIGEAGPEAVIPLDRLDSMMGTKEQNISVMLDGRTITRAVIKNMPSEVRIQAGIRGL